MTAQQLAERSAPPGPGARGGRTRSGWPVAIGLILLSAIPLTAGSLRLIQLAGGPAIMPADDRFGSVPVALLVHIIGSATFALLGALQFVPGFRRRHWAWHRRAGRVLSVAGLLVAGSGLWMTLTYAPQPGTGDLLYVFRLLVGTATIGCLGLGFAAIRKREFQAHQAWMTRAYALGLGAGTQILTEGLGQAILGPSVLAGDLAKGAGWVVNLAIAEWVIRRAPRATRSTRTTHTTPGTGVRS